MVDFTQEQIDQAEARLRPLLPHRFRVTYTPDMPRRDGTPYRWFQVVFAIGSGETATLRAQVHLLFPKLLATLSEIQLATDADLISLRARRFVPDSKTLDPDYPVMFIEAEWTSSTFQSMWQRKDYSTWAEACVTYYNRFDRNDVLTKQYAGQSNP